jgi:CrcB protein
VDKYVIVGLGGFLGACARYWVSGWAAEKWGASYPFGALLINVTGSFLLWLFLAATSERLLIDPPWRLLLAVGFLGAYTTFSTYTYESVQLLLTGNGWSGIAILLSSNLLGLLASVRGIALGRRV